MIFGRVQLVGIAALLCVATALAFWNAAGNAREEKLRAANLEARMKAAEKAREIENENLGDDDLRRFFDGLRVE